MIARYAGSCGLAALVTAGLFFLMQSLIASKEARLSEAKGGRIMEFVRLKRESAVETKKRELPDRAAPDEPPPPDMELSDLPPPDDMLAGGAAAIAAFEPKLDLGGGPSLSAAPSDADAIPLVRVNPQYPPDAMMRGIEGWVLVEFTVTTAGSVRDVKVLDADPKGYFERSAINAVNRYRYKPKVENGEAIERPGVQLVLSFKLQH